MSQLQAASRSIFLSWEALPLSEQNGIITGYFVTITDLDDVEGNMDAYTVEALNITINELIPYTTYGLLLTAHTSVGSGPSSDLHPIQTKEEGIKC